MVGFNLVKRNFHTLIVVIDPTSKQDITNLLSVVSVLQRGLPLRISPIFDIRCDPNGLM